MALKVTVAFSLLFISLLFASAAAHNITRILSDNPEFSSFNSLLSNTGLTTEINRRRTITVLAVSNDAIGSILGFSLEVQRRILSVHVVLDYYDLDKLRNLKNHSTILTTLFQASGIANSRTGFLNVTKFSDERVAFGSAADGASLDADLEGSVAARPYNISVLQVSSVILPPGIEGFSNSPPPPPASSKAPAPAKDNKAPPPKAPAPAADAPATKTTAPAPAADAPVAVDSPADAPVAVTAPADSPVADGPTAAPEADSPRGDEDEAKSGAGRIAVGASIGVMGTVLLALL